MGNLQELPDEIMAITEQFILGDDFGNNFEPGATKQWSIVDGDTGASVAMDGTGYSGLLQFNTGALDNREAYLYSTIRPLYLTPGVDMSVICRFDFVQRASNKANLIFGLMSNPGTDMLVNDGAGPQTDEDMAVIYLVDGESTWSCGSAYNTQTQPGTLSEVKAGRAHAETSKYQTLKIEVRTTGAQQKVSYFCDPLGRRGFRPITRADGTVISHTFNSGGATARALSLVAGTKAGSNTEEWFKMDYIYAWRRRT